MLADNSALFSRNTSSPLCITNDHFTNNGQLCQFCRKGTCSMYFLQNQHMQVEFNFLS